MVDAVNSNPPNSEPDLDSLEAVNELIIKLEQVIKLSSRPRDSFFKVRSHT